MLFKSLMGATCACLTVVSFNSNAALIERLGGAAYYDTEADLTWLADANYAKTSGYDVDGFMSWDDANTWVAGLDVAGVTGWRLPDTIDVGNDGQTYTNLYQGVDAGFNITTHSELSNMFYNVLGNTASYDTAGIDTGCFVLPDYCLTNTGPFSNLQSTEYWSATEYAPDTNSAWYFNMIHGNQYGITKTALYSAWAVQSGNVSVVPVPAATWLFGSGLLSLVGFGVRKKT